MITIFNKYKPHLIAFCMSLLAQLGLAMLIAALGVLARDIPIWLQGLGLVGTGTAAAFQSYKHFG